MSHALANGMAGAGGGIIAQILTYPLQIVNTRQQTERTAKRSIERRLPSSSATEEVADVNGKERVGTASDRTSCSGTLLQMIEVFRTEGLGGLYCGLKPSLLGTAASQGTYYYFYQIFKNRAEAIAIARKKRGQGDGNVGVFSWLVIAALAGSVNVLLTNPIWVLVTRMQTHTLAKKIILGAKQESILRDRSNTSDILSEFGNIKYQSYGTLHAIREVYNEGGIKGFWKGLVPTLIMVCNPSIQFMIYEISLKHLRAKHAQIKSGVKVVSAWEVFLLGALAKLGATIATYPLLVVKSRLQAKQDIGRDSTSRYTGTLDAIIKMTRYEGLLGFYKGMGTKMVQSVFAAAVLFVVKEELVKAYLISHVKTSKILIKPGK